MNTGFWPASSLALFLCASALPSVAADSLTVDGFSQPNRVSKVAASTAGILSERSALCGSFVSEGQCIAQLDSRLFEKSVEVARIRKEADAERESAAVELAYAQQRLRVLRQLAQQHHASAEEILRASSELQRAESQALAADEEHRLRLAEYQRLLAQADSFCVKAPFNGVITEFVKQKGEWVGQSDPHVCTIAQLDVLTVDFLVPSHGRTAIEVDQEINVLFVDSAKTASGKIYFISPFANAETNTFEVHVRVDNPEQLFSAGQRCQIQIPNSALSN